MHKYKVCDKVRVAPVLRIENDRGKYKGRVGTIHRIVDNAAYPYILHIEGTDVVDRWLWCESDFLPVVTFSLPDDLFEVLP